MKNDSKWKAIFFMNLFALTATGQSVLFKLVADDGVSFLEVSLITYAWIAVLASI